MDNKKVLGAEDDPFAQKMFTNFVTAAGGVADIAADGQICLDKFKGNSDGYKIIFMDLTMPNMDGFEMMIVEL
ncbi:response regulator receiver domain protein [Ichthyophthirius multifiliis]|uniref:Response regulator receiver domain protein n=1 Tax=Ichthyophthirius multifiliis TaxID=5932 RepID=G0QLC3_ICHMU|nr:response regulator receiver domain protein [Ichthyophthirius multifiliis]EGR33983.1 response regulator receiver domain protein [Ichthyophthirius multifiliis]|eukprot:XP_004039287.1 response regulator receiver domain protein [Ichthyophthirius multifiliis]